MHKPEIIIKAIELYEKGNSQKKVAKLLGISRSTVRGWLKNRGPMLELVYRGDLKSLPSGVSVRIRVGSPISKSYVYLLGVYLGDGHINKTKRTYRLRIFQDSKYPGLIQGYKQELQKILPHNKVHICDQGKNCKIVSIHSNKLPELFPQHGPGRKHKRKIKLCDWQNELVNAYPEEMIRGLLDSDGSRFIANQNDFQYVCYQFTNMSEDIKDIFCHACDIVGVKYWRKTGYKNVSIRKREAVAVLEKFYDPKH